MWNSNSPPEPDSRDEHKIKDFMIQKYERKRWYIPPAPEDTSKPAPTSIPEPKPLKHLLGENTSSAANSQTQVRFFIRILFLLVQGFKYV